MTEVTRYKDESAHVGTDHLAPPGRVVRSTWGRKLMTFLMVMGPGLIVMAADNDAGTSPLIPRLEPDTGFISSGYCSCFSHVLISYRKW